MRGVLASRRDTAMTECPSHRRLWKRIWVMQRLRSHDWRLGHISWTFARPKSAPGLLAARRAPLLRGVHDPTKCAHRLRHCAHASHCAPRSPVRESARTCDPSPLSAQNKQVACLAPRRPPVLPIHSGVCTPRSMHLREILMNRDGDGSGGKGWAAGEASGERMLAVRMRQRADPGHEGMKDEEWRKGDWSGRG